MPRKVKLLVRVAGLPAAGRATDFPVESVAPQSGRTQPQGVNTSTR